MEIIIAAGLMIVGVVGLQIVWLRHVDRLVAAERAAIAQLVDKALSYAKATSLEGKVAADTAAEKAQLEIQAYKDAIALERESEKAAAALEPKYAHTADGREIDLRDWEVQ